MPCSLAFTITNRMTSILLPVLGVVLLVIVNAQRVPQVKLSPHGPTTSRIGMGALRVGQRGLNGLNTAEEVLQWMQAAVDEGITLFDTANVYPILGGPEGDSLRLIGEALVLDPGLREEIQIVAKIGLIIQLEQYVNTEVSYLESQVEWYLETLQSDYVDILLLHFPDRLMDADAVGALLDSYVDAGKVRYVGVSNFYRPQFELLQSRMNNTLVTNEIEVSLWNPYRMRYNDGSLDYFYQQRIRTLAWGPLGGGPIGGPNRLLDGLSVRAIRLRAALRDISRNMGGVDIAVLALAWVLKHPSGIVPLLGTTRIDRIQQLVEALDVADSISHEDWWSLASTAGLCPGIYASVVVGCPKEDET